MTSDRLRLRVASSNDADEDRNLIPIERALTNVRLAAFTALEAGASRQDVDREVAEAVRVVSRMRSND